MSPVGGEWRTFRGPPGRSIAGSVVAFAVHSPIIGLFLRDDLGQIWLGWGDTAADHFEVSWRNLGGPFVRGPVVQAVGGAEAVVVAVRADGELSFAVLAGPNEANAVAGWTSLEMTTGQDPVSVSWGPSRVDVFSLSDDNTIQQTWLHRRADCWVAKGQWVPVAEEAHEMPTAVSWGPRRLDLFGRSAEGSVLHKWWDDAADRLDIFTVENTSKTTHKYWHPGTGWLPAPLTQWEDIGGALSTAPIVVTWGGYHLDLFGRGYEGHLQHFWWGPENGWEPSDGWEDMHGVLASAPVALAWGRDRLGVFAISPDNTLIYKYRDPGIYWRPSLTRWHETRFPGFGEVSEESLRADIAPGGQVVISAAEKSMNRAHVGLFHP